MPDSPYLAIVWHSRTGASEAMAAALADGAGAAARLMRADQTEPGFLLGAAAFAFVCPENLGALSGAMKEMFDTCYYPLLGRVEGRAYATAVSAGSAGHGAEMQIDAIARGWRLRRVADSLIVNLDAQSPEAILADKVVPESALAHCHDLGKAMGQGIELGIF